MDTSSFDSGASSTTPIVLIGIILLLLIAGGIAVFLFFKRRTTSRRQALLTMRAVRISLPKQREETPGIDPKERIAAMETVFSAISHFYNKGMTTAVWDGQPTFSFEITAQQGEVFFHVLAPEAYLDQLVRIIHAQYPMAHLETVSDYDIFLEKGGVSTIAALTLQREQVYPIKTYRSLEQDPLSALTGALAKLGQGKAAVQILVQPELDHKKDIEKAMVGVHEQVSPSSPSGITGFALDLGRAAAGIERKPDESPIPRVTPLQEQQAKLLTEKASKLALSVQIRVVTRAAGDVEAEHELQSVLAAFSIFNAPESNGFKPSNVGDRALLADYIYRAFSTRQPSFILTTEELASIYHFPNGVLDTPNIHWLGARKYAPPTNLPTSGVAVGYTDFRGAQTPVYLPYKDRLRHLYMIGKTGVGKTALFQNMVLQDIRNGFGVCYLDPNGDAIEWILRHIPTERLQDVILVDPADVQRPIALNLLEYNPAMPEQKTMVINEVISIFDKLYDLKQTGGPIFEQYMRNAMLLIMDDPESGSTLMEIPRVLADPQYRAYKLSRSKNPVVIDFWTKEAEKAGGDAALANMVPYITSKLTQFTSNDIMRPIIGQQQSSFDFRAAMDDRKIILVSLPKGLLGEMNAKLLGMIISGKIQIAAFSRQNVPEEQRIPFFLYVDEFQNFTSKTFATILSEARKYKLSLNITHQYIEQLDDETRSAVVGNVGTLLAWRIGATDAEFLQKEMQPVTTDDMVSSEAFTFYIRMLVEGAPVTPFNVTSYAPDTADDQTMAAKVREFSRTTYGADRQHVEESIRSRSQNVLPSAQPKQIEQTQ